jgi:late competence protein required for DNA uptake (superfamily II DNA/RNA helicase)
VTTAAAAGNTPQVTGTTYLRPGEDAKKNWRFMGIVMAEELRSGTIGSSERTPVARCTDVEKGQFAPKKVGAVCISFLDCLRCRNCVITGDDLHKVFSLYWRVYRERSRMDSRKWRRRLAHIPRLIDRDVIAAGVKKKVFTQAYADACRERAKVSPHPFWADDSSLEVLQ